MSKEISSSRVPVRNTSRHFRSEGNENEFENPPNSIHFPSLRAPLNSIQDPSQIDDSDAKLRPESSRFPRLFPEKRAEALDYGTPKAVRANPHSEPNSAQSTPPARSVSRASNHGSSAACTSARPPQYTGGRGGSLSRVSRGISVSAAVHWPSVVVPHFELVEDSSFWMDHNVQVGFCN